MNKVEGYQLQKMSLEGSIEEIKSSLHRYSYMETQFMNLLSVNHKRETPFSFDELYDIMKTEHKSDIQDRQKSYVALPPLWQMTLNADLEMTYSQRLGLLNKVDFQQVQGQFNFLLAALDRRSFVPAIKSKVFMDFGMDAWQDIIQKSDLKLATPDGHTAITLAAANHPDLLALLLRAPGGWQTHSYNLSKMIDSVPAAKVVYEAWKLEELHGHQKMSEKNKNKL